jgi:hypothetical protein
VTVRLLHLTWQALRSLAGGLLILATLFMLATVFILLIFILQQDAQGAHRPVQPAATPGVVK